MEWRPMNAREALRRSQDRMNKKILKEKRKIVRKPKKPFFLYLLIKWRIRQATNAGWHSTKLQTKGKSREKVMLIQEALEKEEYKVTVHSWGDYNEFRINWLP
jgi:hypothetical protein